MFSFEQIKELIELVAQHRLRGVEIERSGFRLSISGQDEAPVAIAATSAEASPRPPASAALPAAPAPTSAPAETMVAAEAEAHLLKSPIVGTFYAAPAPDAEPYVRVGDRVRKGQVLCIVEAMKLMNEIESDVDGEILQVFPKNAQPVEFGEPLFAVRTS